jgi:hypothetical protein
MLQKDSPAPSKRVRGRADEPSLLAGLDALTGDMSGEDIAWVLRRVRFHGNGSKTIALDKPSRDYIVDCVSARIGLRRRSR